MPHSATDNADADFDGIESYGSLMPSKGAVYTVLAEIALGLLLIGLTIYHLV